MRMNQVRWPAVALLLTSIALTPHAARAQEQKLTLGLHLQAGKSYNLHTSVDQQISQTIDNKKIDIFQLIGFNYVYDVRAVAADGMATVKINYKGVQYRNQGPMGIVDYDSADPPQQIPPAAKGFAVLLGESFTARLAANGRVADIQGVDAMLTRMLGQLNLPDGPQKTDMEHNLKSQFGDQALKATLENVTAIYPDHPVGIGDTWDKKITVDKGFPMVLDGTWTLKERRNGVAVIAVRASIRPNPNAQPVQLGAARVKYALSGEMSGTLELDEASGWTTHGQMTQRIAGQIWLLATGPGQQESSWPITIKSNVRTDADPAAIDARPAAR